MKSKTTHNITIALSILLSVIIFASVEYYTYEPSTHTYHGVVVEKGNGYGYYEKSYEVTIKWDTGSQNTITVPKKYFDKHKIGDDITSKLEYIPFVGSTGYAYIPNEFSGGILLMQVISIFKFLLVVGFFKLLFRFKL